MSLILRCLGRTSVSRLQSSHPRVPISEWLSKTSRPWRKAPPAPGRSGGRPSGAESKSLALGSFSLGLASVKLLTSAEVQSADGAKRGPSPNEKPKDRIKDDSEDTAREEATFDWWQFLKLLYPHSWYLLAAVVSAICAAYCNIQVLYHRWFLGKRHILKTNVADTQNAG